jgi:hypothetical protein
LGHLKDLEISKYKRESKGRMLIKSDRFIFVNCCLIWLSKYKIKTFLQMEIHILHYVMTNEIDL